MSEGTESHGMADQPPGNLGAPSIPPAGDLMASLRALVESEGLNPELLSVAIETDDRGKIRVQDRHLVPVFDGEKMVRWPVPSLRELFRGSRMPPADMSHFPPEYVRCFVFVETHFLTLCQAMGVRTDQEMEEVYSMLRRRPDGKSLGKSHDFLWQVAALLLGTCVLSAAEFEGLFAALTGSTRKWGLKPVSRNYAHFLETSFGDVRGASAAAPGGAPSG